VKLRQMLLAAHGSVRRLFHRREEARVQTRLDARDLVAHLRFMSGLDFGAREQIVGQLRLDRYRAGEYVVRQGEPGEHFYVIRSGRAEVVQVDEDGWPRELATLQRGDYFGELALLYHQPRSASVR